MAVASDSDLTDIAGFLTRLLDEERDEEAVQMVVELLRALRKKNTELEMRVQKLLRQQFGRKHEGVSNAQLSLFLRQLSDSNQAVPEDLAKLDLDEDDDEDNRDELAVEVRGHTRRSGRRPIPPEIERRQHEHRVEGEGRLCPVCKQEKTPFGHEICRILDFEPARFVLHEHRLEKVACRPCGDGVTTAPGPNKVIEGGIPGPGLLASILVDKYRDGLPLYRQAYRFSRLGLDLPRSTLIGWVAQAARVLEPIANCLAAQALASFVLHTDATGLDVLDKKHPNNIKRGSLLCHVGDNGTVFFKYVPNQSKEGPQEILKNRVGYVCADAAGVYDGVFSRPGSKAIELGCMMHARRYFKKALEAGDLRAAIALKYIKRLYKIERQGACMDSKRRGRLRQKKSKPVLASLHTWIAEMYAVEPPGTSLHKALTYAVNQWQALIRYAEDGRLPIDNGPAERAITTVAVSRKNYLFAGSDAGGDRAAVIYSVLGSCALAKVEPWSYLKDVFEKIANRWPAKRIDELLPKAWQATRALPAEAAATDRP
ncbi:MAG: IS66 family transposase [Pseudomonadota bacterium]